jgi:hypothetical protein
MPKCRNGDYDVHPSIGQCPHCGAPIDKLEAVKLYKDQKGTSLLEAKQAVESLAARHGLVTQRAGCLGMVVAVILAVIALGAAIC